MRERVVLYFPEDHWIMDIPKNDRVKAIKKVLDRNHELEIIKNDISEIKNMLMSGGNFTPPEPVIPQNIQNANHKAMLRMIKGI